MSKRTIIAVTILAGCGAAVAGTFAGRSIWPAARSDNQPAGDVRVADPFLFVVEHTPIVCRDANVPVSFEVPILNRTAATLHFKDFACDCGCTAGGLEKEQLQPGESARVRMTVNLSGREGAQRFACHWHDQNGQLWTSETRVTIYKPAQFDPGMIRLGRVAPGDKVNRQVHYDEYATTEAELTPAPSFSISSIHREQAQLMSSHPVVEVLGPGLIRRRTSIDVAFTVANRGVYTEFYVKPDAVPSAPSHASALRVAWSVPETVELSPARLALTFPAKGEVRRTEVVRVRSVDGHAIAIKKLTPSDGCIQARVRVASTSSEGAEIEVTVALPEGKRFIAGDVFLQLASGDSREVQLLVTAFRSE